MSFDVCVIKKCCDCTNQKVSACTVLSRLVLVLILTAVVSDRSEADGGASASSSENDMSLVLDGKRLFFKAEERRVMASEFSSVGSIPSLRPAEDDSLEEQQVAFEVTKSKSVVEQLPSTSIHYMARVQGGQSIRVIINDAPCLPVNQHLLSDSRRGLNIMCSLLNVSSIKIVMEKDGRTLNLVREGVQLGTLRPGDIWK